MKTAYLATVLLFFFVSARGYSQQTYITSLQMPCYPALARQARVEGIVQVKLTVAEDGSVASAEALEGNPLLSKGAVDNVRTWKFDTTKVQPLTTVVVFDYKLETKSGGQRCADRVVFDSFRKVTVVSKSAHWEP